MIITAPCPHHPLEAHCSRLANDTCCSSCSEKPLLHHWNRESKRVTVEVFPKFSAELILPESCIKIPSAPWRATCASGIDVSWRRLQRLTCLHTCASTPTPASYTAHVRLQKLAKKREGDSGEFVLGHDAVQYDDNGEHKLPVILP